MDTIGFAVDHQSGMTSEKGIVAIKERFHAAARNVSLFFLFVYPERSPGLFYRDEAEGLSFFNSTCLFSICVCERKIHQFNSG